MAARLGPWRATYQGVACPRCRKAVKPETFQSGDQVCFFCGGVYEAVRFDPVEPRVVVPDLAGTGPEGAAPCTRHARNQAEAACSRCGQFMCSLCRIDADGKTYCPTCYERLSTEGTLASAVTRVRNWAGWAGVCIVVNMFYCLPGPVAGPLCIFCCVKGLKEKKLRNESDGIVKLYVLLVFGVLVTLSGIAMYVGIFGFLAMGWGK
jgi:hypothetical protein